MTVPPVSPDGLGWEDSVVHFLGWIQYEPPGDPRPLLWSVAFPVNQVLGTKALGSRVDPPDSISRTTVNDPGQRGGRFLGRQRAEEDRFKLRHMERRVNMKGSRQLKLDGNRVNPVGNLEGADELWGELLGIRA